MGAWDATSFGNDDASDWAAELQNVQNPGEFLEETLKLASRDGYLDATDGSRLVAAAAVTAAALGGTPPGFPEYLRRWISGKEAGFKHLAHNALLAIDRVRGEESELRELWEETEQLAAWRDDLDAILASLH